MFETAFLSYVAALSLSRHALAAVVSDTLTISNVALSPDGFSRSTVLANGPLITGNIGDNFQINVVDQLTDTTMRRATSIHWHGIFQARSNEMDGPAWVNQCPIIPGNSFLYNFNVFGQSGTYWYHSHDSTQYCDGLRGALVLYDPNDPLASMYDVDDANTADPNPDSTLINGLGRYDGGPTESALAVVNVIAGQRYRFRIVSTSCYPSFTFSIDGHNMTVIEADGTETQPLTVDSLVIFSSQRYSVVVTANQAVDNYWIRAEPSVGTTGFANGINSGILRYAGAPDADPTTRQGTGGVALNEANLVPLINPGAPGEPIPGGIDLALNMLIQFVCFIRSAYREQSKLFTFFIGHLTGKHTVNGVSWAVPNVPVLLQILHGTTDPTDLLPAGSIYTLPGNSTIEISLPGAFPHPIHLHGHNFDVVRVAGRSEYNYANPVRRDTVNIGGASDNVTFRFTTNNAGPWYMHCHIDWHLEGGLAVVFTEDTAGVASANTVNAAWNDLCPDYANNGPDTAFE
ncbi:hypothetical protein EW145_g7036 [Phellinidium pouzarii]|uniref:Laccase n=1 Tax=Phellinidium pouzarii TaxID=167371 RepID=A0A4S4KQ53_9AGAM|nr:hypothetical protein EW145_g7036 [Phellinidium pouzarii]